jgi:2-keto-4-pentenoate hydratase
VRASLEWLRNHLAEAGLALLPGQIVLAGTPLGLYPVLSGDRVAVFVNDEIGVECTVR